MLHVFTGLRVSVIFWLKDKLKSYKAMRQVFFCFVLFVFLSCEQSITMRAQISLVFVRNYSYKISDILGKKGLLRLAGWFNNSDLKKYLFICRQRQSVHSRGRGSRREKSRLLAEWGAQSQAWSHDPWDHELWDHDLSWTKSWTLSGPPIVIYQQSHRIVVWEGRRR